MTPREKIDIFGKRLMDLRKQKNKSRQKAADELGISRASLEFYEKGLRLPNVEVLTKIAVYFNASTDYLLGLSKVKCKDPEQKSRFDKLSEEIADCYGVEKQKNQLIEEMAELTQAIIKLWRFKRGVLHKAITEKELMDNLIEEMADVKLVLDQLIYLMDAAAEVQDVMEYKVKREMNRILDTPIKLSLNQDLNTMTMPEEMGDVECE